MSFVAKTVQGAKKEIKKAFEKVVGENDPTKEVDVLSSAFIWKTIFSRLPSTPILEGIALSGNEVKELLHCCLLSRNIYKEPKNRYLPKNLSNVVAECFESDYYKIPYFVVNSDELDTIYIVCRGSYCFKDFLVDFMASTVSYRGGQVHEGVYLTALNLFNSVKPIVQELQKINGVFRKVVITGHSLGAGVAAVCTEMFNECVVDYDVRCVCFAPVASFTKDLWVASRMHTRSYIVDGDFVPFISYHNAINLPQDALPALFRKRLNKAIKKRVNRHASQPEFQDIITNQTEDIDDPYALYPPGNCFLIKMINEKTYQIEVQKIKDCDYFGQFVKELNELRHMMKIYKAWTVKYFSDFYADNQEIVDYYDFKKKRKGEQEPSNNVIIEVSY